MYHIYHIPGVKIGVSQNVKKRMHQQKWNNPYEILESHDCIDTVSDREIELQKQYGYPVDTVKYKHTVRIQISGALSKKPGNGVEGGKTTGKKNIAKLHAKVRQCPYCSKNIKGPVYTRWHGKNCKENV